MHNCWNIHPTSTVRHSSKQAYYHRQHVCSDPAEGREITGTCEAQQPPTIIITNLLHSWFLCHVKF